MLMTQVDREGSGRHLKKLYRRKTEVDDFWFPLN